MFFLGFWGLCQKLFHLQTLQRCSPGFFSPLFTAVWEDSCFWFFACLGQYHFVHEVIGISFTCNWQPRCLLRSVLRHYIPGWLFSALTPKLSLGAPGFLNPWHELVLWKQEVRLAFFAFFFLLCDLSDTCHVRLIGGWRDKASSSRVFSL